MLSTIVIILLVVGVISANLPWISQRFFFFFEPPGGYKALWMRLLEWLSLFLIYLVGALGVELKVMGNLYRQGWEFYVVLFCLYLVFALPGFIYRHDLKPHLEKRERRKK